MGVSLAGSVLIWGLLLWLINKGFAFQFALIPACIPFAYFCIGFVEFVSGVPFARLGQQWMELKGWQRGVLGTFIILAAIALMLCLGTAVGVLLSR